MSVEGSEVDGGVDPCEPIGVRRLGFKSWTITVPDAVPSLFHNSTPLVPSLAEKKRVLPMV